MTHRFAAATAGLLGALTLAGAVAPPAGASTTGPSYGRFSVSFPSSPGSASNTKEVLSGFPPGMKAASAYWVSPVADPLGSSSSAPPAPTYLVVVGRATSAKQANSFTNSIKAAPGAAAVSVGRAKGYRLVGTEKQLTQGTAKDPGATEAFMYLSKGTSLYAVIVISDSRSKALGFLGSFRPA